nr:Extracellular ligand-binding receptor and GPCR domain containing protein [Haemonchus contortus]
MQHIIIILGFLTPGLISLSCKPRAGGTPVPIGVFLSSKLPAHSLDQRPFDAKPAIKLALNYIQNHSCILDGYKLELIYKDTQCKTSLGMKALFDLIASRPRPVALFGGMCTEVNEPVAMALKYWQVVQLSYAETHAKFGTADSQELYPTFFRIVPGDRNLNNAKCRLINHFGWKKVGTLKQSDEPRHALPHEALTTKLEHGYGIKVLYTAGVTKHEMDNIGNELDELKNRDVRILVVDIAEDLAAYVLCEAFHRQMYGESYLWILPGYHSTAWMGVGAANCTSEDLNLVLEGHFAVEFALVRKDNHTHVIGGKRANYIWSELESESSNIWQGYLYDGLWTLAIALSQALGANASFSHMKLLSAINNSSFEGVTGRVRFENNERLGLVDIRQWKNGTYEDVGYYDGASDVFNMKSDLGGWEPPLDATVIERRREYISNLLFVVMSFLAFIGISLAFIFLFFNIRYRNHRFIKMSSPNLNNLIIVGSMCTFASVVLLGIDTRILSNDNFVKLCYVKSWTLCLGFTLAFGSMFSKTWRVHSIFTNIRMDRKAIKDSKLLLILAGLLFVDILVLTLWAVISPFRMSVMELPQLHFDDKVVIPEIEKCQSNHSAVFQAVLYAIKGVLMILGCFLAWETRHVNVPALNDSKYIGMSVYNVVVMSTLGLSISVILQERVNEAFALACFFIIFSTTLTLCLVFVPKIIELVRNPDGNNPRSYRRGMMKSVVTHGSTTTTLSAQGVCENEKNLLAKAEAENQLRRRHVHQKSTQLWDLLEKLRELGDTQFLQQDWCFSSGMAVSPTNKDLLQLENKVSANGPSSLPSRNGDQKKWPWSDPEEPSTML